VFTQTAQASVTVTILFDKNLKHVHSDTVASPNKHALQSICFLFLTELSGYKSYNLFIYFDKLL